ncbi:hypothetical protein F0562_009241 [Nyssa sinensis]|uniref:Uncharacterized protein n=1 Tax=Nyssa sinensis TaxID=561372 RepID=A0A5J4ZYK3_9ASTE|nr:hypothetical protein F0562_009241 [Nyssa sinensis]
MVAVIEPVPTTSEDNNHNGANPKLSTKSSTATTMKTTTVKDDSSKDTATVAGCDSDASEIAGERKFGDHDEHQQQSVPPKDNSHEVSSNDEEFEQGQYKDAIKECSKALELNPKYVKALVRRGDANEKLENFEEAIADMKKILELDESHVQAKRTIGRLEPLAAAKCEKMKEEMIGKLMEMGNSILGRFGMSVR